MSSVGPDVVAEDRRRREQFRLKQEATLERRGIQEDGPEPDLAETGSSRLVVSSAEFFAERDEAIGSLWGDALLTTGGSYLIVGGEGGVGKTILIVGLFVALAAGHKEYLGFPLPGTPTPGLILEAEGSRSKFRERFRSIAAAYGSDALKLPLFFHARNAALSMDEELLAEMIQQSGARAVLYDPVGRFIDADENSATEWRRAVTNPLASLARRFGTAAAILDHYVKPSETRQNRHKLRGSAAKVDDAGAVLRLEYGKGGKASRVLFFDRVRDGALPDPECSALMIDVASGKVEVDPQGTTEAIQDGQPARRGDPLETRGAEARVSKIADRIEALLIKSGPLITGQITERVTGNKNEIRAALDGLEAQGRAAWDVAGSTGRARLWRLSAGGKGAQL